MDFSSQDWAPPAGAFRVVFHVDGGVERAAVDSFLRALVGYVPIAPAEAELDPAGDGWLRWDADEDVTVRDRDEILAWIESRPRLVAVRCVAD